MVRVFAPVVSHVVTQLIGREGVSELVLKSERRD